MKLLVAAVVTGFPTGATASGASISCSCHQVIAQTPPTRPARRGVRSGLVAARRRLALFCLPRFPRL